PAKTKDTTQSCTGPVHLDAYTISCGASDPAYYFMHYKRTADKSSWVHDALLNAGNVTPIQQQAPMNDKAIHSTPMRSSQVPSSDRISTQNMTGHTPSKQWASTYPPILPDPDDPVAVAKYALTYMTSIWHHAGTSPMGTVVDESFNILGLDRISIIDAGVLNQMSRMNPTATMLMLG
ncbi:hypothetical protein IE077_001218, partial [Cardiosporidium cionae]